MMVTLAGRLAQFAIMLISLKVMTSLLAPVQMGKFTLVTTGIVFFAMIFVNPVGMLFNRRLHAWFDSGNGRGYTNLYAIYLLVVGLVAIIIWLSASKAGFNPAGLEWKWVVVLVGGSLFFNTAIQTLIPTLNMLGREVSFAVLNVSTLILSLIFSLIFCFIFGDTAEHWLAGTLTGQAIFSFIAYLILFQKYPAEGRLPRVSSEQTVRSINFCWPIAITVGLQWMHMQGYRFFLADQFGLAEFGLFAVGYGVAVSLISAGETILATWFQPGFYRAINSNDQAVHNTAWNIYAGRMLPASLLGVSALIAASNALPSLMLGAAYQNVGNFIIIGAIAEWGRMVVGIFGLNAHRQMATRQLILPNVLGACVAILGFLACVQIFGLGIWSTPICAFFGCSVVVVTLWKFSKREDAHIHLNLRRLASQSIGLLLAALIMLRLTALLPYQGVSAAALTLLSVGLTWAVFAFKMRDDLKGISAKRSII
jgi:hypothetical protein